MNNSFSDLYKENYKKLFRVAYRLSGNIADAEDILQDAFANAYKAFEEFEGKGSFISWVYKILIHCAYKHMKKLKKLPIHSVTDAIGISEEDFFQSLKVGDVVIDRVLTNDIRENCLQMFLNCMPKKQRIAFTLKVLMGCSIGEIASIMDITENAVKINIYRARQHMKNNMEGRCSLIDPKNPCDCSLWAKYIRKGGVLKPVASISEPAKVKDETLVLNKEILLLEKIKQLYDADPPKSDESKYINMLKEIISQKKLRILS